MKACKILVMGLPGAGKTTFATTLVAALGAAHINADAVRKKFNDWDFSPEGRLRQAKRMNDLANAALTKGRHVVADFICPTPQARDNFSPDLIIWMDTIAEGRFEDTNKMFIPPENCDYRVENWENNEQIIQKICERVGKNGSGLEETNSHDAGALSAVS